MSSTQAGLLEAATAEIEAHVGAAGWDRRPTLFALVRSAQLAADDVEAAARLGLDGAVGDSLT
ncbi:MAG: PPA1309 family protein, partial [Jatrophihabitantaceae bacterium]